MNATAHVERLSSTASLLIVEWGDGTASEYPAVWLRDNLPQDRDRRSGQRLVDIADLPCAPRIRSVTLRNRAAVIEWRDETIAAVFEIDWLFAHASTESDTRLESTVRRWLGGADLSPAQDFAWTAFSDALAKPLVLMEWLRRLLQDGIAFFCEVPATDAGILDAMALVGLVAQTNYGLVFDVRSVAQPENLAYSDLGLGLHTDNPYRDPVPGFQALHVLVASPDGGDSLFADGFALAEHFRQTSPQAFDLLTRTAVPFAYRSAEVELSARRPLIELSSDGRVAAVHYNSRSIAPLPLGSLDVDRFYVAYREFAKLLRDSRFHLACKLHKGDLAVFDNQRILHGRTAFSSAVHPRHVRGCYLTRDSVYSAAAVRGRQYDLEVLT